MPEDTIHKLLAILQVRDFDALDEFERKASDIMSDHGGKIVAAFESCRNEDGSGEEVHLLDFKNEEGFTNYRNDDRHQALKSLRDKAIASTEVKVVLKEKSYS